MNRFRRGRLFLLSASIAVVVGCASQRMPPPHADGDSVRALGTAEQDLRRSESELGGLMAQKGIDCGRAFVLRDNICALAARICTLAESLPATASAPARCTDAKARCQAARTRVAGVCPESGPR